MTVLSIDTINPNVRTAQYAVRGLIPQRAESYRAQLARGEGTDLPFDKVIFANIGNPQQLDQKPITFFRQVASLLEYAHLLDQPDVLTEKLGYKSDAIARARRLLKEVNSVGAYSNSSGAPGIRQSVAEFIEREWFLVFLLNWLSLFFCPLSKIQRDRDELFMVDDFWKHTNLYDDYGV
jgi:alanine transaminase